MGDIKQMVKVASLSLLLNLAVFSTCGAPVQKDDETAALEKEITEVCPGNPDELTERILAAYRNNKDTEKVKNAAEHQKNFSGHQDYHLYTAIGDTVQAEQILADIYVKDGVACPQLKGTPALHQQRRQFLIDLLFTRTSSLSSGIKSLEREGVKPTTDVYIKRGDYWMESDSPDKLFRAFESYEAAGYRTGVEKVFSAIEAELNVSKWRGILYLALEASLYLGNQTAARHYASNLFINDPQEDARFSRRSLELTGLRLTPDLYQLRGEFQLTKKNYVSAFNAFQAAGDEKGIGQVVEAITAPISAERQ